eukprot:8663226-Karenia_brevis.AAC.1
MLCIPPGASWGSVLACPRAVAALLGERVIAAARAAGTPLPPPEELVLHSAASVWGEAFAAIKSDVFRNAYARACQKHAPTD